VFYTSFFCQQNRTKNKETGAKKQELRHLEQYNTKIPEDITHGSGGDPATMHSDNQNPNHHRIPALIIKLIKESIISIMNMPR
jgi:hypothetical protein